MFVENQVAREQTSDGFRRRLAVLFASLGVANLLAWIWAVTTFADQPVLLGAAVLACSLGLRHALDADHIAAIDNVTRKLMQEGTRPLAVGLFFALGCHVRCTLNSCRLCCTARVGSLGPGPDIAKVPTKIWLWTAIQERLCGLRY
jgi:high-affinity nickel permease